MHRPQDGSRPIDPVEPKELERSSAPDRTVDNRFGDPGDTLIDRPVFVGAGRTVDTQFMDVGVADPTRTLRGLKLAAGTRSRPVAPLSLLIDNPPDALHELEDAFETPEKPFEAAYKRLEAATPIDAPARPFELAAERTFPDSFHPPVPDATPPHGHRVNMRNRDLRSESFVDADLRGVDLTDSDLRDVDMSGADLEGADLSGAILEGTILSRARLTGARLIGARLTGAELCEVQADKADFSRAVLADANLIAGKFEGATFTSADLSGADLRLVDVRGCSFVEADLSRACFQSADARGASLYDADVGEATFRDADLRDARVFRLGNFKKADWIDANISSTDFRGAYDARRYIMDENYLWEFRHASRSNAIAYYVWRLTCDCGRNFSRWLVVIGLTVVAFAAAYTAVDIDFGANATDISPLYFSIVTATTLGYGDALPVSSAAQIVVMAQAVMSYMFLGALVSIIGQKLGRRA